MRTIICAAALGIALFGNLHSAQAKDWGDLNVDERLAYTEGYIKRTCNHMPRQKATAWQRGMLAVATWNAVKSHLDSNCPSKTAQAR